MVEKIRNDDLLLLISHAKDQSYESVINQYEALSDADKLDSKAMYYLAEALYELQQDIPSLRAYSEFVSQHPENRAVDYALMGMAVCLKNLDLHPEALSILGRVKPDHPDLVEEIEHSNEIIKLQFQAKTILKKFES